MSATQSPTIRKAKKIMGKTLTFRNATVDDAAFILSLRTDEKKSLYLSATSADIKAQQEWLEKYAAAEDQAYFIIEHTGESIGTVRLYDAQGESFCWGSWILKDEAPQSAAIESVMMVYAYAVDCLGFRCAHFDVRKGNEGVWRFHERFGAERVAEGEEDYYYRIGQDKIAAARQRYKKYLPESVIVEAVDEH